MTSPARVADPEEIRALHAKGLNGAEIALLVGVSRERVRQIIKRDLGVSVRKFRGHCRSCGLLFGPDAARHYVSKAHLEAMEKKRQDHFWSYADKSGSDTSTCWEWTGYRHAVNGYGISRMYGEGYAHRVAYRLAKGPIAKGMTIDHLCRNRGCVNPAHLEAVSQRINILRSPIQVAAINARKTECIHGHPFTDDNTYARDRGGRACKTCARERAAAAYRSTVRFGSPRPAPKPRKS